MVIIIAPVDSNRSDSGSGVGVALTTAVPTKSAAGRPDSKRANSPPGAIFPPEKKKSSVDPSDDGEQVRNGGDEGTGQSNVFPASAPVASKLTSKLVMFSVNDLLKKMMHPSVDGSVPCGGVSTPQVAASNGTNGNGALGSTTSQLAIVVGVLLQTLGSRTWTWKSTASARAILVTPQNRARINKTRRRCFIFCVPPKWVRWRKNGRIRVGSVKGKTIRATLFQADLFTY
jgi:hypothetical protein